MSTHVQPDGVRKIGQNPLAPDNCPHCLEHHAGRSTTTVVVVVGVVCMVVVVVVVVVVQMIEETACLSRLVPTCSLLGGRTPGSKLPASPPPLLRPDGGGQTLALCLCKGPYQHILSKLHETCSTRTTGTSTTQRVLQIRNLYGPPDRPDHGNRPLRHDREVNLLDKQGHRPPYSATSMVKRTVWTMEPASAPQSDHA